MYRVIICSPFSGAVETNIKYARECLQHSLDRREAAFASHLLYPQVLDDAVPRERDLAMEAEYEWIGASDLVAFYIDLGWSKGMLKELKIARLLLKKTEQRTIRGAELKGYPI